ncbi:Short-chain dehydrogenase [Amycolatopsis arida]|uniref:Short-chain dehydrogenase n=1 Tax=Amycolatopsis arida TaxID=587909 RepID=A0A1I5Q514_9PSEU|nr:SDR family NAD(P)-dependent oxidoreductase [Amycolatopsis arida]TDX98722.1 short-subunit dehydrogenase [Amycolatopsis arida]SFP41383.1 Short-chain dehydrogenase [Amycolatopsis arida]
MADGLDGLVTGVAARYDAAAAGAWRTLGRAINGFGRTSTAELRRAVAGRTVLVTGASFGIGEATARRLARAGATVLLAARTADRLHQVTDGITAAGGRAFAYPTDLTDGGEVDTLVKRVLDEHDHVDVLVNNAGKSIRRSLELSYDRPRDFERTINVNYLGPVRLTLGLLPSMRARRSGHVVSVSTWGVRPLPIAPRWSAYLASKAAFDVWMRSMALEVRGDGVTASTVYMGLVHTRMSAPTPALRRLPGLTPEDAARVVCDAIVRRPATVAPWWAPAVSAATSVLAGPIDRALGLAYELTRGSERPPPPRD